MRIYLAVFLLEICSPLWAGWEALGPFGGSVAVVQVDRHHHGTVFAATSNAQVFRSEDDGATWRALPFPAEFRATLHAFVIDSQVPDVILAGLSSNVSAYSGILRTTDGGLTWKRLKSPGLQEVWSIAISPRDDKVIAAGTVDGVLITHDGGESWDSGANADDPQPRPVVSLAFDQVDSMVLYAGTPHLPWKSLDGGLTWHSVHTGMLDDSDVFSLVVDNQHRATLFAGACGGIYRSRNSGSTWTKLREAKGASERTYQIAQHPLKPNVLLAATAHGLTKSVDGGDTWRALSAQPTRWISFDGSQPNRIFVASDDGLFRSDDLGEHLEAINHGFTNRRATSIAALGDTLLVTLYDSTGKSIVQQSYADAIWKTVTAGQLATDNPPLRIVSVGSTLYLVTSDGLFSSTKDGQAWMEILLPSRAGWVRDLLFATEDGTTLLVATQDGTFRTTDAGRTWALVRFQNRESRMYAVVRTENHALLAATSEGLMRSDNAGATWRSIPGVLGASTVTAVCKHPRRPGMLFAAQYGTVFASKDDGYSWTPIREDALQGDAVSALLVMPGEPDRLLALTDTSGLYAIPLASK